MQTEKQNKYVEQAIKQIREHYKEDINISTVAEQLQISEGYLSRVFKKRQIIHLPPIFLITA